MTPRIAAALDVGRVLLTLFLALAAAWDHNWNAAIAWSVLLVEELRQMMPQREGK